MTERDVLAELDVWLNPSDYSGPVNKYPILKRARDEIAALRSTVFLPGRNQGKTAIYRQIRAEALEEAAIIAEGMSRHSNCCQMMAHNIRALKDRS